MSSFISLNYKLGVTKTEMYVLLLLSITMATYIEVKCSLCERPHCNGQATTGFQQFDSSASYTIISPTVTTVTAYMWLEVLLLFNFEVSILSKFSRLYLTPIFNFPLLAQQLDLRFEASQQPTMLIG